LDNDRTEAGWRDQWPGVVIGLLSGLVVFIAGNLVVDWIRSDRPNLTYLAPDSIPFQGEAKKISTYQVIVTNEGKKAVDDVVCVVTVPDSRIEQNAVVPSSPSIEFHTAIGSDNLKLELPSLNPSESVQVSIVASGSNYLPIRPRVALSSLWCKSRFASKNC
jgi:hypothetical protein